MMHCGSCGSLLASEKSEWRKRKVHDSETYILLLMGYMYLTYQNTQKW